MQKLVIFFGSDTGNTETVAGLIERNLAAFCEVEVIDVVNASRESFEEAQHILIGIPTWYYGESQADWDDFMPTLKEIDFTGKKVAIFGCGDQEDYADYFLDAMGTVRDVIVAKGAAIVGLWPTEGYNFESSKALVDDKYFVGLGIDEDRQPELTQDRVDVWCEQLKVEFSEEN